MDDIANLNAPACVQKIWNDTCDAEFMMASEPLTGALLRVLAASKPRGQLLELGSGTGLATAWLLDGTDATSTLLTVDNDEAALSILRDVVGKRRRRSCPNLTEAVVDLSPYCATVALVRA